MSKTVRSQYFFTLQWEDTNDLKDYCVCNQSSCYQNDLNDDPEHDGEAYSKHHLHEEYDTA